MTTMTTVDAPTLTELRQRRAAGEAIKALAAEVGMSWQRLWGLLHTDKGPVHPAPRPSPAAGPLTERYRPRTLDALWGQEPVVRFLKRFAASPYPAAFLFEGATGTGKTSAARGLAEALGCDVEAKPPEFGGVHTVASGEQTAETVRDLHARMWQCPLSGSGWKVVIVNEADRMHPAVETIWLDRLEVLPPRTVIVFTTNHAEKLTPRFRDRCTRLGFESDAVKLQEAAERYAGMVWRAETHRPVAPATLREIVRAADLDGELSFRRVVQEIALALMKES